MESADRESRRLDILSVKKEANLSAREVGEVEVFRHQGPVQASNDSKMFVRHDLCFIKLCWQQLSAGASGEGGRGLHTHYHLPAGEPIIRVNDSAIIIVANILIYSPFLNLVTKSMLDS